jgi:transposase-like protein
MESLLPGCSGHTPRSPGNGVGGRVDSGVAAGRYARATTQRDYRYGSYMWRRLTKVGELLLSVPRCRGGGVQFQTLRAYARRPAVLDQLILACFVLGMSTQKVAKALSTFLGTALSADGQLDRRAEAAVATFHCRPPEALPLFAARWGRAEASRRGHPQTGPTLVPMGS